MKTLNYTWTEWVAAATHSAKNWESNKDKIFGDSKVKLVDKDKKPWTGVRDWNTAVKIATEGYIPEGGFNSDIDNLAESENISALLDVSGSVVDVGLFLTGEPECMWEFQQAPSTKFIDLVINLANSGGVSADDLFEYAAKVYSLLIRLKQKNIEANVIGVIQTTMGSGYRINIDIHKQGQVFSPATLSAALHPMNLRRLYIGFTEGCDDYTSGSGRPQTPSVEEGQILLPSVEEIGSVDKIEEQILSALNSSIPA